MNKVELETKFSTNDTGEVEAIAWPFGSPDRVGDIITKGAFSTEGKKLPMLWAHEQRDVIGVWESMHEADDGLHVKGRLLLESVPRAREVHAMLKAGAVNGVSIGFTTRKSNKRKDGGRNINSLLLHEVSIVAVPMHPAARVVSFKGAKDKNNMNDVAADPANNEEVVDQVVDQINVDEVVEKALAPVLSRLAKMETKMNRPAVHVERKDEASEYSKAWSAYICKGGRINDIETKTMIVGNDVSGGYLAPPEFNSEMIRNLVLTSPIRGLASVRTTANNSVVYPSRTAVTNAVWHGEAVTRTESEPTFGQVSIPVREMSTYTDVSNTLLQDSGGSVEAEIRLALATDFGQKEGLAFVSGDGVVAPTGLLTDTNIAYQANTSTTALSSDALISMFYSLAAPYRANATWIMNSTSLAAVRTLKDGTTGVYLWQAGLAAGQPDLILGKPVVEVPDLPNPTSGLFPILVGDFSTGFRIIDRIGLSVLPDPYSQATSGLTRFHATRRVGSAVIVPGAIKKLKMSVS